jgi:hypothetical protein
LLTREPVMAFEHEKRTALRMLEGIELGTMTPAESYAALEEADPTLVYFIFKWLRKRYRDHPAAEGVLGRLAEVCNTHRSLTRKAKQGEDDPVVGWFESTYAYQDLEAADFIDCIVEKLEG